MQSMSSSAIAAISAKRFLEIDMLIGREIPLWSRGCRVGVRIDRDKGHLSMPPLPHHRAPHSMTGR